MTDNSQLVKLNDLARDIPRMIDNAGTSSQNTSLVDDAVTREAITLNVATPFLVAVSERDQVIDALQARVAELEAEGRRIRSVATDRLYMMEAYRSMLGPKGLEVVAMWNRQGVTRQHTSWGPEAWTASGEDRAAWLLEIEAAPKTPSEID